MITDSSTLIIFAKINELDLLIDMYKEIYITEGIYKEVVEQGSTINAPDANILKNFIDNKKIKILKLNSNCDSLSKKLKEIYPSLGVGESEAISLSLQEKNEIILIDETFGRKIAKLYNLKPIGSLRVLIEAYRKKVLDENNVEVIINKMLMNNFYLSVEVLNEFWDIFEKIKKQQPS